MKVDIVFSTVVLAILIAMMVVSTGYPPKARLFPLILIIITAGMVGVHLIKLIWGKTEKEELSAAEKPVEKAAWTKYCRAPLWIVGFLLTIYLLGFLVGCAFFSVLYLKVHGEKWVTAIGFSLGVIALVYGGFEIALKTPLYGGLLFN